MDVCLNANIATVAVHADSLSLVALCFVVAVRDRERETKQGKLVLWQGSCSTLTHPEPGAKPHA